MHGRVRRPSLHDQVNKPLEGGLFLRGGNHPAGLILRLAINIESHYAEKIFQSNRPDERVALYIKEQVGGGRRWKLRQPLVRSAWKQFENRRGLLSAGNLDSGLLPHSHIGFR